MRQRVLVVVVFTVFLDLVGYGLVIPLLPLYVTSMRASALSVGLILTCFSLAQLIATPLLGRLSDRYGRRRIILVSLVGNAVSMLVFAAATHVSLLWLLFVSRVLAGATSGNLSACQAALADVTRRQDRAAAMGRLGAGIGLGLIIGPVAGGQLSSIAPWAPPVGAAVMAILDVVLTAVLMPETRWLRRPAPSAAGVENGAATAPPADIAPISATAPLGEILPDAERPSLPAPAKSASAGSPSTIWPVLAERRMASVLGLYFLTFLCMTNLQVALALLAKERMGWGAKEVSNAFGLLGVCGFVIQGVFIGRLVKSVGEPSLVIAGAALNIGGMICIAVSGSPAMLLAGVCFIGVGIAVTNPSLSGLASRLARDEQQGAVLGFAQSAGGLARAIGPTWSGFLFAKIGAAAPFVGGAIAAMLSLIIGLYVRTDLSNKAGLGRE